MKGLIKSLLESGRKIYPITRSRAVVCEDGRDLEQHLEASAGVHKRLANSLEEMGKSIVVELFTIGINANEAQLQASSANSAVQEMQGSVSGLQDSVVGLEGALNGLDSRVYNLENGGAIGDTYDDSELRGRIDALEVNNNDHQALIEGLQTQIQELEAQVAEHPAKIATLEAQVAELQEHIANMGA